MAKYQKEDLKKIYLIKSRPENLTEYVKKFKDTTSYFESKLGNNDSFSEKDLTKLFKEKNNDVASVGRATAEHSKVIQNWDSIYQKIRNFDFENTDNETLKTKYAELLNTISKGCKERKPTITNRLLATFFSKYLTATCSPKNFQLIANFMHENFENYPEPSQNWLLDNINFVKYCRESFEENDLPIAYFAWQLHEDRNKISNILEDKTMTDKNTSNLAKLLTKTKNIILHGAPGTGKTYLAKDIAAYMNFGKLHSELNDEEEKKFSEYTGFVQFHPSYDYTDFVEGIRPLNDGGQIGFERRDGVFKEFCARALQNYLDSNKSLKEINQEQSIDDTINSFISDAIEQNTEFEIAQGNKFFITDMTKKSISISIPANEKSNTIPLSKTDLQRLLSGNTTIKSGNNIKDFFNRKWRTQQDSYMLVLYNKIKNIKITNNTVSQVKELKNFVFIIDEINRGELSKIFGELFFSIDPGYRGKEGKIRTQYANMQDEQNKFDEALGITDSDNFGHFFVPANVYIIGTMNDIDRSIESMDLAMRRRFTFREITAKDTQENILAQLDQSIKTNAENRMDNLNNAIWNDKTKTGELPSSDYHIGAAYFTKLKDLNNDFDLLWKYNLAPLLREYLRGQGDLQSKLDMLKKAYDNQDETTKDNTDETQK